MTIGAGFTHVSAGSFHTLAIYRGKLYSWGSGGSGQLGLGDSLGRNTPTLVTPFTDWESVFAGPSASFAIRGGQLFAWGENSYGQLGLGDTSCREVPVRVGVSSGWEKVSASDYRTFAIRNGELWGWGRDVWGKLGTGNPFLQREPVRVGSFSDWVDVSAGGSHTLAVRRNGELWCFGRNSSGQLGLGASKTRLKPTIKPVLIKGRSDWAKVSAGWEHSFAITKSGELFSWGSNSLQQLGHGGEFPIYYEPTRVGSRFDWESISAFPPIAIANGSLFAWCEVVVSMFPGVSLKDRSGPVRVSDSFDWKSVSGGMWHVAALKEGRLFIWGMNLDGQLGLSDFRERNTPTEVNIHDE